MRPALIGGNPIGEPTGFSICVGVNPGAINIDEELRRLDWKIDAGAEYMITQPVFDAAPLLRFIDRLGGTRIPIVAPERIREARPDYVLILPWNLKDEISRAASYIGEWGGRFVVPIPVVELL